MDGQMIYTPQFGGPSLTPDHRRVSPTLRLIDLADTYPMVS
jgi:hypothetical protein